MTSPKNLRNRSLRGRRFPPKVENLQFLRRDLLVPPIRPRKPSRALARDTRRASVIFLVDAGPVHVIRSRVLLEVGSVLAKSRGGTSRSLVRPGVADAGVLSVGFCIRGFGSAGTSVAVELQEGNC